MSAPGDAPHGRSGVGSLLRVTRQRHGLTVRDIAVNLRIRAPYLEAIEDGRLADLPAPAYAVGFVKAYAKALGLDEGEILRRFRAEADGLGRRTRLEFPAPVPERGVPAGAVAMLGIVLAAGAYGGWWYLSGSSGRPYDVAAPPAERQTVAESQPRTAFPAVVPPPIEQRAASGPLAGLPLIPPGPSGVPSPPIATVTVVPPIVSLPPPPAPSGHSAASAQAAVPPAPPPLSGATLPDGMFGALPAEDSRVLVRARAETWIQVRDKTSGAVVFNRTLQSGQSYRAPLKPGLLLTIGNAPGTDVLLDGQLIANPFPATSVRRDIPLEPDRVRDGLAAAPVAIRAPATPSAPTPGAAGAPPFNWGN
jgi:cytoskeleton protein RodZ